jgi:hypothetical protein
MKLCFFHEFAHLFASYGQVFSLDPATAEHIDFREARVRVGLCDGRHIPPLSWIIYCDPSGFWTRYDIEMEVEQSGVQAPPIPPPLPPRDGGSGGVGPGDRARPRPHWSDPGVGSNGSSDQPPQKKMCNGNGTGKDKEEYDDFEILDNGDLLQVASGIKGSPIPESGMPAVEGKNNALMLVNSDTAHEEPPPPLSPLLSNTEI